MLVAALPYLITSEVDVSAVDTLPSFGGRCIRRLIRTDDLDQINTTHHPRLHYLPIFIPHPLPADPSIRSSDAASSSQITAMGVCTSRGRSNDVRNSSNSMKPSASLSTNRTISARSPAEKPRCITSSNRWSSV